VARILIEVASRLFFLGNKSQEQITEEYRFLQAEVRTLTSTLEEALRARVKMHSARA